MVLGPQIPKDGAFHKVQWGNGLMPGDIIWYQIVITKLYKAYMSITWPTSLGSPKSSVSGSGSGELTTSFSILYSRFLISSTIPGLAMVTVVKEIANNVRDNIPNILFNVTDSLYCWQCWASILEESDWVEGSNCWVHSDIVCLKLKPILWTACLPRCTHKARIFFLQRFMHPEQEQRLQKVHSQLGKTRENRSKRLFWH